MKRFPVAVLILLCLAASLSSVAQQAQTAPTQNKELTIEAMFSPGTMMQSRGPESMKWSPDGTKISFIQRSGTGEQVSLYYLDPATGKSAVLVAAEKLAALVPPTSNLKDERQRENRARFGVAAYHWGPDSKSILFDALGHLWLYDLAAGKAHQLTNSQDASSDPKFSDDASHIAFVRNHNLFIRPTGSGVEKALTSDTDENILNGEVDWVYSEELDVRSNYFWSPDSKQIVFLQMNEAPVPTYPIVDWIPTHPTLDKERYPKAGDKNPTVKLAVTDLNGKVRWITPTTETDIYIPRFGWVKPGVIWAMVMNRRQNQADLYFIDAASGKSRLMLTEKNDPYLEVTDRIQMFKSGDRFLWPSWRDGHTHLYLYSFDKNNPINAAAKLEKQITSGEWQVSGIEGVDEAAGIVYFTANKGDYRQTHLFSVKLDGTAITQVTRAPGSHSPSMSENVKYYVDTYSSLATAPRMVLCATFGGECSEVWKGKSLEEQFGPMLAPKFVDFKAEDGTLLHGVILLPKQGPAMVNGKSPVILNPYGGPHGQSVRDSYSTINAYDQILARRGFAVLKVDNRGMGNRGLKFAAATYGHLGDVELRDQLSALDQAIAQFPVLDAKRTGFWGWSYGGSMTAYAMTHTDRFKAGVSVAPVTDWRNYDSIYTERYMNLPQENAKGYDSASIINSAPNLSGKLLLVHGTSDDNVHMQNSMQFINAMINGGKPFDLQLYPQKTHGIGGFKARVHLYNRMLKHFEDNLGQPGQ
ncbi:MAG TPA: DPP IV N-terminal domain-containing protein [Clostridia bacterium]|nr:DPP IV N-terminal domain-containing protein [Clostridia bacterium]